MHFCLLVYCGKSSTNITKHLLGKHKEEYDIKEINRHQEISKTKKTIDTNIKECWRLQA